MAMSLGKWRRLQQVASSARTFSILAVDHRGPLWRSLEKESPGKVPTRALAELKSDIVRSLNSAASAVLLDPETGVGECVATGALAGSTGLLVALDTGSTGDSANKSTSLVPGWSVEKAVRVGAAGLKLLVYYHPQADDAAATESLVQRIAALCQQHDMPFFLEPLSHALDKTRSALPSDERRAVVVESARRLAPLGVDVLKMEFPVDIASEQDENAWRAACQQLTDACPIPWVLLSGGVSFDDYVRQVRVACQAGASGIMAGRAVWREAVTLDVDSRRAFLGDTARQRMEQLRSLTDELARPFDDIYQRPNCDEDWYANY